MFFGNIFFLKFIFAAASRCSRGKLYAAAASCNRVFSKDFGLQPAGGEFRRSFGRILGADFRVISPAGVNSGDVLGVFFLKFRCPAAARAKSEDFRPCFGNFFS